MDPIHQSIPLTHVVPSPWNPRKTFEEDKLLELAASICSKGVLQPILVRPFKVNMDLCLAEIEGLSSGARQVLVRHGMATLRDAFYRVNLAAPTAPGSLAERAIGVFRAVPGIKEVDVRAIATALGGGAGAGAGSRYELVAGERRLRAAKLAGLVEIPAVIRGLSDVEVLEIQVIENEQREGVSPIEKAEGYARLVERGVTVEDLATRVGKSASTIRDLLRLPRLPEKAKTALQEGDIPASTAGLIARVPTELGRERLTAMVLTGVARCTPKDFSNPKRKLADFEKRWGEKSPLSYRETKELIELCCQVELKSAPFNRNRIDLVPGVGSCETCPKRIGNLQREDPEAYAGVRADVCTDPGCFRDKVDAHQASLLEAARASGKKILSEKERKAVFNSYNDDVQYNAPYVDLAVNCFEARGNKTWAQMVGKQLADQVVLAVDSSGIVHELVPKAAALKIVREKTGSKTSVNGATSKEDARSKKEEAERRRKAKIGGEAAALANGKVAKAMQDAVGDVTGWNPEALRYLRAIAGSLAGDVWSDVAAAVGKRRGLAAEGRAGRGEAVKELADRLLHASELLGLIAELVAARKTLDWKSPYYQPGGSRSTGAEQSLLQTFGVRYADMVKEVGKETKADTIGKAAANGKHAKQPKRGAAYTEDPERILEAASDW